MPQVQGVGDFADACAERVPEDTPGPAMVPVTDKQSRPRDGRDGRVSGKRSGRRIAGKWEQDSGPSRRPQPSGSPVLFCGGSQSQKAAGQKFPGAAVKQIEGLVMFQMPYVEGGGEEGETQRPPIERV